MFNKQIFPPIQLAGQQKRCIDIINDYINANARFFAQEGIEIVNQLWKVKQFIIRGQNRIEWIFIMSYLMLLSESTGFKIEKLVERLNEELNFNTHEMHQVFVINNNSYFSQNLGCIFELLKEYQEGGQDELLSNILAEVKQPDMGSIPRSYSDPTM